MVRSKAIILLFFLFKISLNSEAQIPYNLIDSRNEAGFCEACQQIIESRPKEVLFGIHIRENGDVYFSMKDKKWFEKIFSVASGLTVDIVSKDQYECGSNVVKEKSFIKGFLLPPVYKDRFKANLKERDNDIMLYIGKLPAKLVGKELEGNLVILNGNRVCFYTNFINIPRSEWGLLPMGLYTDTLLNISNEDNSGDKSFFTYNTIVQRIIPFQKNKSTYSKNELKPLYDSLGLSGYVIKKIEIRAYSSVEGTLKVNSQLMELRAKAIIQGLRSFNIPIERTKIIAAENWLEFIQDIKNTPFAYLANLPKNEIKIKLTDPAIASALEPLLSKHRKAVVTVYLGTATSYTKSANSALKIAFDKAVSAKEINSARVVLKEIMERIIDKRLPETYINQLEVPMEKAYVSLLNDKAIYQFALSQGSAYEALDVFDQLRILEPKNAHVLYNYCAFSLYTWMGYNNEKTTQELLKEINKLPALGIEKSLVKRMLINYHILISSYYLDKGEYEKKDEAVEFIKDNYINLSLNDADAYSLAKYFTYYSQDVWAMQVIADRVDKLEVSEDIVFYYINLMFYQPELYKSESFKKAMLNAVNLNQERFCELFNSTEWGGASMQLLEHEVFRQFYCESCYHLTR